MKKKILTILTIGMFLLSLVGCSNNTTNNKSKEETNSSIKSTETSTNEKENDETTKILAEIEENIMKQLPSNIEVPKDLNVGVLIISTTNPFWSNMQEQYENAGKELGINVEVLAGTTEDDKISQMEMLDSMVAKKYDCVIVSPIDGTNLIPAIVKLNEAKIPVINLGPGVDVKALEGAGGHLDGRITVNFEDQGKIVVQDMKERLSDKGQVAILEGLSGAGQSEGRTKGAKSELENTNLELVASQPCDWDATKAYEATTTIIKEYPDLKAIFACNDVMALAASEALNANDKNDVLIYGVDGTKDAISAIKDKEMTGSVTYSSSVYTKAALLMSAAINNGEKLTEPIYSPLVLVLPENATAYDNWK